MLVTFELEFDVPYIQSSYVKFENWNPIFVGALQLLSHCGTLIKHSYGARRTTEIEIIKRLTFKKRILINTAVLVSQYVEALLLEYECRSEYQNCHCRPWKDENEF